MKTLSTKEQVNWSSISTSKSKCLYSFSILEHYNLLSKQPNSICILFFFHLMFMVMSWAQSNHEHFQKGLDFSREGLLLYIIFPKINRKPNNSKTEGRKGHTGPPGQPRGEELPCRFLSPPVTLSRPRPVLVIPEGTYWAPGQPRVRKSCLAGSSLDLWPCHGLGASRLPTENKSQIRV